MGKYVKALVQKELETRFGGVNEFVVLQMTGINGNDNNELRGRLKDNGIRLMVVKNAMVRRALKAVGMSSAADMFLAGPSVVAYGGDSVVDVAKELEKWSKKLPAIVFKGAYVDGQVLDSNAAGSLAKIPGRAELQGMIVGAAGSVGGRVAASVSAQGAIVAGCIDSLVEKLEKQAA